MINILTHLSHMYIYIFIYVSISELLKVASALESDWNLKNTVAILLCWIIKPALIMEKVFSMLLANKMTYFR